MVIYWDLKMTIFSKITMYVTNTLKKNICADIIDLAVPTLNVPEQTSLPKFTLTQRNRQSSDPIPKEPSTSAAIQLYSEKEDDVMMKENIDLITLTGNLNVVVHQDAHN